MSELGELRERLERMRQDRDRVSRENVTLREKYQVMRDALERAEAGGVKRRCAHCGWSLEHEAERAAQQIGEEQSPPPGFPRAPSQPLRGRVARMTILDEPAAVPPFEGLYQRVFGPPGATEEQCELFRYRLLEHFALTRAQEDAQPRVRLLSEEGWVDVARVYGLHPADAIREPLTLARLQGYAAQLRERGLDPEQQISVAIYPNRLAQERPPDPPMGAHAHAPPPRQGDREEE